jgi:hypothetical protein
MTVTYISVHNIPSPFSVTEEPAYKSVLLKKYEIMIKILKNEFIYLAGNDSVDRLLNLRSMQSFIGRFILSWLGSITVIINMVVLILSTAIYN